LTAATQATHCRTEIIKKGKFATLDDDDVEGWMAVVIAYFMGGKVQNDNAKSIASAFLIRSKGNFNRIASANAKKAIRDNAEEFITDLVTCSGVGGNGDTKLFVGTFKVALAPRTHNNVKFPFNRALVDDDNIKTCRADGTPTVLTRKLWVESLLTDNDDALASWSVQIVKSKNDQNAMVVDGRENIAIHASFRGMLDADIIGDDDRVLDHNAGLKANVIIAEMRKMEAIHPSRFGSWAGKVFDFIAAVNAAQNNLDKTASDLAALYTKVQVPITAALQVSASIKSSKKEAGVRRRALLKSN